MAYKVSSASTLSIYGSIALERAKCPECSDWALVLDGKMACCDVVVFPGTGIRRMSGSSGRRLKPSYSEQQHILASQHGRCFYCGTVFGDAAYKDDTTRVLGPCWDHVEPFCWQSNNQLLNFVAACSICNGIKSNKVFATYVEAIAYVWHRRKKKGWTSATEEPPDSDMRSLWRPIPKN